MAPAGGRASACCGCELGLARGHLERAMLELEQARLAWGVWADGIRKLAEQAHRGKCRRRSRPVG